MTYKLHYSDYPGTDTGPPDPAAWIGPPGPQGPPGPVGPMPPGGPFLPLSGGVVTPGALISTKLLAGDPTAAPTIDPMTAFTVAVGMGYTVAAAPMIRIGGSFYGTLTNPSNTFYNVFAIDNDSVDASAAVGCTGFYFGHSTSAGATGSRTAMGATLRIANPITEGTTDYLSAAGFAAYASASAGGAAGTNNQRGNLFAMNPIASLQAGAGMFWNTVCGVEIGISTPATTAAYGKVALQIVQQDTDATPGTAGADSAIAIASQYGASIPGHDVGISFGIPWGWWPIKRATGKLIAAQPASGGGGPAYQAAYGVDFTGVTFSQAAFKSTGFQVDGAGRCSPLLANAANDGAAAAAGVPVGAMYRNGNAVQVRLV